MRDPADAPSSSAAGGSPPRPFLTRLIIFHLGLLPPSDDGGGAATQSAGAHDESASAEELAEYVLYYYDAGRRERRASRRRGGQPRGGDGGGGGGAAALDVAGALDDLEASMSMMGAPPGRRSSGGDASVASRSSAAERRAREEEREELGEAARFAGLCAALRTLPAALGEANAASGKRGRRGRRRRRRGRRGAAAASRDFAEEVRMESSTLVFVPLECDDGAAGGGGGGCDGLVAVAQLPRSPPAPSPSSPSSAAAPNGGGGAAGAPPGSDAATAAGAAAGVDPAAVRAAVARRHRLFALTRGGGVHHRLRTDCDARGLAALEAEVSSPGGGGGKKADKKEGDGQQQQQPQPQQPPPQQRLVRTLSADSISTLGTMTSAGTDEGSLRSRGGTREAREAAARAAQAAALAEEESGWTRRWKRASMDHRAPSMPAAADRTAAARPSQFDQRRTQRSASLGFYQNYTGDYDARRQFDDFSSSRRFSDSTGGWEAPAPQGRAADDLRGNLQRLRSDQTLQARNASAAADGSGARGAGRGAEAARRTSSSGGGSSSPYPGMARLYALRRDLRKLEAKLTQRRIDSKLYRLDDAGGGGSSSAAEARKTRAMERSERKLRGRIEALSGNVLALGRLRADLKRHYDAFVEEWEEARREGAALFGPGAQTGVGRCVVERVPAPLPKGGGASSWGGAVGAVVDSQHHPPMAPSPHEAVQLGQIARSLLGEAVAHRVGSGATGPPQPSNVAAVSTFWRGRLLHSHATAGAGNEGAEAGEERSVRVDPEAACLLYEYLLSAHGSRRSRRKSAELLGSADEESSSRGRFLPPPSLSNASSIMPLLLDERTEDSVISLPSPFGDVWAPLVHLPLVSTGGNSSTEGESKGDDGATTKGATTARTRAIFYDFSDGAYCFILFLKDVTKSNHNGTSVASSKTALWSTLISAANRISSGLQALGAAKEENSDKPSNDSPGDALDPSLCTNGDSALFHREPAVDVIYIDRSDGSLVLLNRYDAPPSAGLSRKQDAPETNAQKPRSNPGSKWFGRRSSQESTSSSVGDAGQNKVSAYHPSLATRSKATSRRLDCRHIMASHFPLDVILAFDEMFNEVDRLRGNDEANARSDDGATTTEFMCEKVIEMCTFLPQGWTYCRCHGSRELYMLFDTTVYVTLADVQKAALRVREGLFNGALL